MGNVNENVPVTSNIATGNIARPGKYLTFSLGKEEYGLEILKVMEIIGIMDITAVPQVPRHVKGVINLRGKVIPVISLRKKFDMAEIDYTAETCIIVVNISDILTGIIIDQVQEVLDITQEAIEPPPSTGITGNVDYLLGLGKVGDSVKILLNIDRVLRADMEAIEDIEGLKSIA